MRTSLERLWWWGFGIVIGFAAGCAFGSPPRGVTLAWNPNPETNIAGYRLTYFTVIGSLTNRPLSVRTMVWAKNTQATVFPFPLTPGKVYRFNAFAVDQDWNQSPESDSVFWTNPPSL